MTATELLVVAFAATVGGPMSALLDVAAAVGLAWAVLAAAALAWGLAR